MKRKQRILKGKVLFNASVILSGLHSPRGGSAKVLGFVRKGKFHGVISEVILDEVLKHSAKLNLDPARVAAYILRIFEVGSAPGEKTVKKYLKKVLDEGDAHVLASCEEVKAKYLVTLDKKHLLVLVGKIKWIKIVTPGDLIRIFKNKKMLQ